MLTTHSQFHDSSVRGISIIDNELLEIEFSRDEEVHIARFEGVNCAAMSDLLNGNIVLGFDVYQIDDRNKKYLHQKLVKNTIENYFSSDRFLPVGMYFVDISPSYGLSATIVCRNVIFRTLAKK